MYTEELIKKIAEKTEIDIDKFDMNELVIGMEVELEHGSVNQQTDITGDEPIDTFKIVMAHMHELPDYYTRLKNMEKMKITEYAKRMRELTGLSEGEKNKSLQTVQNGTSSFDCGMTFYAKDMTDVVNKKEVADVEKIVKESNKNLKENFASPEFYEEEKAEALRYLNGEPSFVTVLFNQDAHELVIYKDVIGLDQERDDVDQSEIENYMELSVDEALELLNSGKIRVYTKEPLTVDSEMSESSEFETHEFEQKDVDCGYDDDKLYELNENTIIVLDFLDEGLEKESSDITVRKGKKRKGPTDSATWHKEGKKMKGNDGKMWKVVEGSNGVNRWVRV